MNLSNILDDDFSELQKLAVQKSNVVITHEDDYHPRIQSPARIQPESHPQTYRQSYSRDSHSRDSSYLSYSQQQQQQHQHQHQHQQQQQQIITASNDSQLSYVQSVNYHWLYSARNGHWWLYDRDSNELIESAYIMGLDQVTIHGAWGQAMVDLLSMMQGTREVKRVSTLEGLKLRGIGGKYYNRDILVSTNNPVRGQAEKKDDKNIYILV